jgi:membrane-associated phospholipid phosphatase
MIAWSALTQFGDISVTSLAALAIAAWLFAEDEKRLAVRWGLLFSGGMVVVVATKMAFIGWGIGIRSLDFTGFSGHTMRATAVLPVLFYLILPRTAPMMRTGGALLGFAFGTVVGISRLAVHAHSISEVVAGWLLGALVSISFLRIAGMTLRKHVFNPLRIALSLLALLPAPYVHPAPTQQWLTDITLYFSGHEHPFPRTGWRQDRKRSQSLPAS